MNHRSSSLVLDTLKLRRNISDGHRNGMLCPVSDRSYLNCVNKIFSGYEELIINQDDREFDVLLADYRFVIFVVHHIHMIAIRNTCDKNNIGLVLGQEHKEILEPKWTAISTEFHRPWGTRNYYYEKLRSINLTMRQRRRYSQSLWRSGATKTMYTGQVGWLCDEYIRTEDLFLRNIEPLSMPIKFREGGKNLQDKYRRIIEPLIESIFQLDPLLTSGFEYRKMLASWSRRLADVEAIYESFLGITGKKERMLVNGGTNPLRKILVMAFQRSGAQVTVFHHGNDFGGRIQNHGHRGEVSHCLEFMCPTMQIAKNYVESYKDIKTERKVGTQYSHMNTNYFRGIRTKEKINEIERKHKPIMLVGRPLNHRRLLDAHGCFILHKAQLECDLITLIKSCRENVIYKAHPDTASAAKGLYADKCEIWTGPFEDLCRESSVLIFTSATSTTFGYALSTVLPIVLIEPKNNQWNENVRRKLLDRCEITNYDVDDLGRAILGGLVLKDAIEKAIVKRFDLTFLDSVM